MNMKWKRFVALLLALCTVVSLMGTAAFAAGSDGAANIGAATTPAADGSGTADTGAAATPAADGTGTAGDDKVASDGEKEGGDTNDPPATVALRFYNRNGDLNESATVGSHTSGAAITEEELAGIQDWGVAHWLYGASKDALTGCTADALTSLTPTSDTVFYAAYYVTYKDANDNTLGGEYVLPTTTPTKAPRTLGDGTLITGWKDAGGTTIVFDGEHAVQITDSITFTAVADTASLSTVTFYDYDGTELGKVENMAIGSKLAANQIPASKNKKDGAVDYWVLWSGGECVECTVARLTDYTINTDAAVYAAWCVTYLDTDGTTTLCTEYVRESDTPSNAPTLNGENKSIAGWLDATGSSVTLSEQKPTSNITYTAWVRPSLNTDPTLAYVNGSAQGGKTYRFLPTGSLTRAEAAQMLYNLLGESDRAGGPLKVSFSDVSSGDWYAKAVNTLASYGILNGTGGGMFEPNAYITRGQFVTMVSRLFTAETYTGESPFVDVQNKSTTYYNAVMMAAAKGWVNGYATSSGNYFYPQNQITRAEAVKVLSGVLGRNAASDASKAKIDSLDCEIFIDITGDWAYYWIMDAATGGGTKVPSTGFATGRHKIDGSYYFVDSSGHFVRQTRGVHKMTDSKYYFFRKDGIAAPVYKGGLRTLNDKLYLLDSDGSIIHEPKSNYDTRVYEYSNYLYYINTDGSLAQNTWVGPMYFDSNGRYTSGRSDLDSWVWGFLSDILQSSKSQEEKLYAAYVKMRDFPLERYGNGWMGYGIRGDLKNMTYEDTACHYFQYAQGDCSAWAAAFVYIARRIGYQAWIAEGELASGQPHAWEIIEIGGTKYTFDVEQEWGFMYKYYSPGNVVYRDCWKMTYAPGQKVYYGYRFNSNYAGKANTWSPYYEKVIVGE